MVLPAIPAPLKANVLSASCPLTSGPVHVAVLLRTCEAYRKTRLLDVFASWAAAASALLVCSDGPINELPLGAGLVVVRDKSEKGAFVPPWRRGTVNTNDAQGIRYRVTTDRSEMIPRFKALGERTFIALQLLIECVTSAEYVLIADDDTFVPVNFLLGALRERIDPTVPQLFGNPVSRQFRSGLKTLHCGAGAGILLTRGLLNMLRASGGVTMCLELPFAEEVVHDDTLLGACATKVAGVRCMLPPLHRDDLPCHARDIPTSAFLHGEQIIWSPSREGTIGNCGKAVVGVFENMYPTDAVYLFLHSGRETSDLSITTIAPKNRSKHRTLPGEVWRFRGGHSLRNRLIKTCVMSQEPVQHCIAGKEFGDGILEQDRECDSGDIIVDIR